MKKLFLSFTAFFFFYGCTNQYSHTFTAFYTPCSVNYYSSSKSKSEQKLAQSEELCKKIERTISTKNPKSDLSRIVEFAKKGEVPISLQMAQLLLPMLDYAKRSEGAFNPAIGALTAVWKFDPENPALPDPKLIQKAIGQCNYRDILLSEKEKGIYQLRVLNDGILLDVGGAGKGFACDQLVETLFSSKKDRALISLGGSLCCIGEKSDGKNWIIAVRDPYDSKQEALALSIKGKKGQKVFFSTSGTYEKMFELNGVRYHHILDSTTGSPVQNEILSVTVIAETGIEADILSTTLLVLGAEKGKAFVENLKKEGKKIEYIFLTQSNTVLSSEGAKNSILRINEKWTQVPF